MSVWILWCLLPGVARTKRVKSWRVCRCRPFLLHCHPIGRHHRLSLGNGQDGVFTQRAGIFTKNWYRTHTHTHARLDRTLFWVHQRALIIFIFFLLVSKHIFHTHITLLLMRTGMMRFLHLKQSFQWKESLVCKHKHLLPPAGVCP